MHEAEELCDRVAIIDHGEIIALGTTQELKDSLSHEDVVSLEGIFPEATVSRLRAVPGILEVAVTAEDSGRSKLDVMVENSRAILPRIIEAVTGNGATVEEIRPKEVTLEDVFVAKTGRTLAVDTRVVGEKAVQGRGG